MELLKTRALRRWRATKLISRVPRSRIDILCTREQLYGCPFPRYIIKDFLKLTKRLTYRKGVKLFSLNDFIKYLDMYHGVIIYPYFVNRFFNHTYQGLTRESAIEYDIKYDVYTTIATYPGVSMQDILRLMIKAEIYRKRHGMGMSGWAREIILDLEAFQEEVYFSIKRLLQEGYIYKVNSSGTVVERVHHEYGRYVALSEYVINTEQYKVLRHIYIPQTKEHIKNIREIQQLSPKRIKIFTKLKESNEPEKNLTTSEKLARQLGRRVGLPNSRFNGEIIRQRPENPWAFRRWLRLQRDKKETQSRK